MPASAEAATRPHAHDLSAHLQPRPLPAELLQALQQRFGAQLATSLALREQHGRDESVYNVPPPDAVVIAEAITDASELMDSYLAKRYTLPLPVVPMPLKRICGDITLYLLSGNGTVTDERRKRYDDAIKFLQALAKGDATLGAGVEQDNANSVGQVELDSNPRIFTRRTLRGVM